MARKVENNSEQELINDIAHFEKDPYGFVLYAFPWGEGPLKGKEPDPWQVETLKYIGKKLELGEEINEAIQTAISSGHGIGKSAFVAWIILWSLSTFEDSKGVVTANTDRQLMTKTWPELTKWYQLCICKHWFKCTATALYSSDEAHEKTWRVDAIPWSVGNTEAFAGLHNEGKRILVVFDEASAVDDKIWEVTEGALTDANTQIIWAAFGNPTRNTGRFRECFRKFRHRWFTKQIDSRTVKITNKEQIQKWVDDYGGDSDFVKVRVRGMFPSASAKQFISSLDVDGGYGKHLRPEQYNFAAKVLSVEPAWEGDDNLEIGLRQGLMFKILRTIPKNDNDFQIATLVAQLEESEKADGVVIDGGFGTGIVSAGRTMGRSWNIVWYAGSSPDEGCLNMRAYMWREMRDWLKAGGAIPADQSLYDDLIGPEIVARPDGKLQLEAKKDMKARGIPSPNKGDCLAQTFAYKFEPKSRNPYTNNSARFAIHEYNPWKDDD